MIEVSGLTRRFGARAAVVDVSFRVPTGEIVGFLGPNGAGKTTTLRMLTGYLPPTSGSARVAGYDVETRSMDVRARIGYLPESVPLYRDLTVTGYLEFVATLKGAAKADRRRAVEEVVAACGLEEVFRRPIATLSRGFRQRVGLAQALVNDPEVLFLDEPTVGLDPRQIVEIRELIRSLAGRRTVILSTHILPEVSLLCRRVLIIHRGRLISDGPPEALRARASDPGHIELDVRAPEADLSALLRALPDVADVEVLERRADGVRVRVNPRPGTDPREAIATAVAGAGMGLRSMSLTTASLEDVFLELVTREEAP
jgi:ABC-2 type transport system ATP-binding protein